MSRTQNVSSLPRVTQQGSTGRRTVRRDRQGRPAREAVERYAGAHDNTKRIVASRMRIRSVSRPGRTRARCVGRRRRLEHLGGSQPDRAGGNYPTMTPRCSSPTAPPDARGRLRRYGVQQSRRPDGGASQHDVIAPATPATYIVIYQPAPAAAPPSEWKAS